MCLMSEVRGKKMGKRRTDDEEIPDLYSAHCRSSDGGAVDDKDHE
jgi:hypothetical protein